NHIFFVAGIHIGIIGQDRHFSYDVYMDTRDEEDVVREPMLHSRYVSNGFVELFLPYLPLWDDRSLELICPDFKPLKEVGLQQDFIRIDMDESVSQEQRVANADSAFHCLTQLYILSIDDSLLVAPDFKLHELPRYGERGLWTSIDVDGMGRGEHQLKVSRQRSYKIDGEWRLDTSRVSTIPFWIE
ncbi:MAG: hypothetical protein AAFO94_12325, partial [Bacteroidota bacterium]